MSGKELEFIHDAFVSNWIAPFGPHVDEFEKEMSEYLGIDHAVALSNSKNAGFVQYKEEAVRREL